MKFLKDFFKKLKIVYPITSLVKERNKTSSFSVTIECNIVSNKLNQFIVLQWTEYQGFVIRSKTTNRNTSLPTCNGVNRLRK